jgi:hypothetical protein
MNGRNNIPASINRIPAKKTGGEYWSAILTEKNAVDHNMQAVNANKL